MIDRNSSLRESPLPDFLIIGAMKAGTTTLYRDLYGHPQVFLPEEKEPDTLTRLGDNDTAIRADFASLFRKARPGQIRGEASTSYTKRPDFEGVAERTLRICGPDIKLIYIRREPVKRLISHYRHDFGLGYIDKPIVQALTEDSRYVDWSSYDWQIAPWRETFGADRLLELDFEAYVADRKATLTRLAEFLGIDPALMPPPEEERAFNASSAKPIPKGWSKKLVASPLYQRVIKPMVPWKLRDRVQALILPKARESFEKLDPATEAILRERIIANNAQAQYSRARSA